MNRVKNLSLTKEEQDLVELVKKISLMHSMRVKENILSLKKRKHKKNKRKKKHLEKSAKERAKKSTMKTKYAPFLISQALRKGIPLREPEIKKGSRKEPEELLIDIQERLLPDNTFSEFVNEFISYSKGEIIEEFSEEELVYKPTRLYLQKLDEDNSKIIVKMFVDWGYLRENKLTLFLDEDKNELAKCVIHLVDDNNKSIKIYPLKPRTKILTDDEPTAESLFIGIMDQLQPNTKYKYRIECYKIECGSLFAGTDFIPFKTQFNLEEANKPIFLTVASDLHGGRKSSFLRGKLKSKSVVGNKELEKVYKHVANTEKQVTFNQGYNLSIATGDITENASYSEYWADLFERARYLWNHVPLLTAIGNHDYYAGGIGKGTMLGGLEEDCRFWHRYITNPVSCSGCLPGHWYSIDQGNLHLVFIDSNGQGWGKYQLDCESEQWAWLENDLKEWREKQNKDKTTPQFCILFLHSAIMSSGYWGRGFNWGNDEKAQSYLTPLIRKYGIDMVFFGHDHIYQRSHWLGTTYINNGCHGGMIRGDIFWARKRALYEVQRTNSHYKTRIYPTIYVPPNIEEMNSTEKEEFNQFLETARETLLDQPTASFYYFGVKGINRMIGRGFDRNKKLKAQLIEKFILPKLKDHIWLRSYYLKDGISEKKRFVFDMAFIKMKNKEEYPNKNYEIHCPERVVK